MHRNLFRSLCTPLCGFVLLVAASTAFAENPWVGKWKLDPAQSKLTGDTLRFASRAGGEMTSTSQGHTSKFKLDGQPYKTWSGDEATWKKIDDNTFEQHVKVNGVDLVTNTWIVSSDGKSLKIATKGKRPDGSAIDEMAEYARVSGTKGLAGSWKDTKVEIKEDQTYEIAEKGPNEIAWTLPEIKATLDATLDGKEVTPEGPTVPKGFTIALLRTSPKTLKMTQKMNGEIINHSTMTLSADGKKITEVGSAAKVNEPYTSVWVKQ